MRGRPRRDPPRARRPLALRSEARGTAHAGSDVDLAALEHGILEPALAARMRKMAAFRDIAVHDDTSLDPAIVAAIAARHLGDLRDFVACVVALVAPPDPTP